MVNPASLLGYVPQNTTTDLSASLSIFSARNFTAQAYTPYPTQETLDPLTNQVQTSLKRAKREGWTASPTQHESQNSTTPPSLSYISCWMVRFCARLGKFSHQTRVIDSKNPFLDKRTNIEGTDAMLDYNSCERVSDADKERCKSLFG